MNVRYGWKADIRRSRPSGCDWPRLNGLLLDTGRKGEHPGRRTAGGQFRPIAEVRRKSVFFRR